MGSILHGNAKTTPRVRKEIQNSTKNTIELAKLYNLTPKTVIKWKNKNTIQDGISGGNRHLVP